MPCRSRAPTTTASISEFEISNASERPPPPAGVGPERQRPGPHRRGHVLAGRLRAGAEDVLVLAGGSNVVLADDRPGLTVAVAHLSLGAKSRLASYGSFGKM